MCKIDLCEKSFSFEKAVCQSHGVSHEVSTRSVQQNLGAMMAFNLLFASVIAFGVVYNSARVTLSERSRELASLRVMGFTRAEISRILLGELGLLQGAFIADACIALLPLSR